MSDLLLLRLQSGKVRNLEETVETWQITHTEAMRAADVEDLVRECLTFPPEFQRVWERVWEIAKAGRIKDFQFIGLYLRGVFDRALNIMQLVERGAWEVGRRTGHHIAGLPHLAGAREAVSNLRERILSAWPWEDRPWPPLDREMVAESRESSSRGEGEDVSALLERAKSGNSL